jgi:hypothetical protein
MHLPPACIVQGEPTQIEIEFSVWGQGTGKMSQRWTEVRCHYRLVGEKDYATIPMRPIAEEETKIRFAGTIPPQERVGAYLVYYIDELFDGHYNRRNERPIPIVKAEPAAESQPETGSNPNRNTPGP